MTAPKLIRRNHLNAFLASVPPAFPPSVPLDIGDEELLIGADLSGGELGGTDAPAATGTGTGTVTSTDNPWRARLRIAVDFFQSTPMVLFILCLYIQGTYSSFSFLFNHFVNPELPHRWAIFHLICITPANIHGLYRQLPEASARLRAFVKTA